MHLVSYQAILTTYGLNSLFGRRLGSKGDLEHYFSLLSSRSGGTPEVMLKAYPTANMAGCDVVLDETLAGQYNPTLELARDQSILARAAVFNRHDDVILRSIKSVLQVEGL